MAGTGLAVSCIYSGLLNNSWFRPHPKGQEASSTLFTTNRSQAVRLPKAVAFPDTVHQVDILKIGHSRLIVPHGRRWDDLFLSGPRLSEDFMVSREQPEAEAREPF
ncbi:MAG TPA: type II toxin-antitoxin system VapB family antitoxin [Methylocella sp.]|nr:type II toxin-antitoxin system VapB family antitoxin [Methylocella sp.]